jgi:hypothetical protein
VRDIRMRRAMWRELETWPWWNGEPNGSSKEPAWKPFTYHARASSRPGVVNLFVLISSGEKRGTRGEPLRMDAALRQPTLCL